MREREGGERGGEEGWMGGGGYIHMVEHTPVNVRLLSAFKDCCHLASLIGGGAEVPFDGSYRGHTKETASLTDNLCPIASNFVC